MTHPFWPVVWGTWIGITCLELILLFLATRKTSQKIIAAKLGRLLWNLSHPALRLSWQEFVESHLRAATGRPLERPFGNARHYFDWTQIQFNPVYLSTAPGNAAVEIDTAVVLGPRSRRPLQLKIPVLIGGMSYGNALSLKAKVSLAKGAALAGTATNSGNGPFLPEERQAAAKFIFQYARGFWSKTEAIFQQADLIEIGFGHGAWVSAPVRVKGQKINRAFGKRLGTIPGLDVLIEARFPEVANIQELQNLVAALKEASGGAPVGVKFGLSHDLEKELAIMVPAGIDIITVDGLEGGTHGGPPLLLDDVGLPTLPGLCRAVRYLKNQCWRKEISLVVGGGLVTPGDFAKSLALGADAVIIGTIAALTMSHTQVSESVPWEAPTGLIFFGGKEEARFDPDLGARNLAYYLESCVREMKELTRALGKTSLQELNQADLVALDSLYAEIAGIQNAGASPG